jgi:hypothetical protein
MERFNRLAAILNESRYLSAVRRGAGIRSIRGEIGKDSVIDYDLPDREELHAFLLTLRLFDQRRDGLRLEQMATLHKSLPVPAELQENSRDVANRLAAYMDRKSKLSLAGHNPTWREIFDVLVYGGHAHVNDDKEDRFLAWTSDDFVKVLTEDELVEILGAFTQAVFWMRRVNLEVLAHLRGEQATDSVTDA